MTEDNQKIKTILDGCSEEERRLLFRELRASHTIHILEDALGAPAEVILEAIHRAPELTRRMLRGVIADAAFAQHVVPLLEPKGWRDVTELGNFPYDYKLSYEDTEHITVQVKLQRSEGPQKATKNKKATEGGPVVTSRSRFGITIADRFVVEVQRTRTGTRKVKAGDDEEQVVELTKTRPYTFGEFNVLAVSMLPSTKDWKSFMYTVSDWLVPKKDSKTEPKEIATFQPVSKTPDADWTDDFEVVARWVRENNKKTIVYQKDEQKLS